MALVLSEEQQIIKDSARDFAKMKSPVEALRDLRDSKDATGYSKAIWNEMGEMGWAGLIIPESYGGIGYGYMELGQIMEETGRTLCASPLLSTVISSALILKIGSDEQKQGWLPSMASGEKVCALAIDETSRHNPKVVNTTAEKTADGYVLNGTKIGVIDGHVADYILVTAKVGDEVSVFVLPAQHEGLSVKRVIMADSRNSAKITLENVKVSEQFLIGKNVGKEIDEVLDIARICLSAEMLGNMSEVFDRTVNYLKERKQFGVAIGTFQGLQHRAAQMFSEIELCKSAVMSALESLDKGGPMTANLASLAKAKVSHTFENVSAEGVQMYGGIGMTDDEEIGFFLKRARVAQQLFGDYHFHNNRYAELAGY